MISTTKKVIDGCEVFSSLGDALLHLHDEGEQGEVFVIGGARLFQEALMEIIAEYAVHRIYLTRVHADIDGDVLLPEITWKHWKQVIKTDHAKDATHEYAFSFEVYERA